MKFGALRRCVPREIGGRKLSRGARRQGASNFTQQAAKPTCFTGEQVQLYGSRPPRSHSSARSP